MHQNFKIKSRFIPAVATIFVAVTFLTNGHFIAVSHAQETENVSEDAENATNEDTDNASAPGDQSSELPQVSSTELLKNGSLEEAEGETPKHWIFSDRFRQSGYALNFDKNDPFEGEVSVMVDSTDAESSENRFCTLNQVLDATPLQGKRVRFRAAVRTANTNGNGSAALWFRVDRVTKDGKAAQGAFDNMANRTITSESWEQYEIVADVDEDAKSIVLGMMLLGEGQAWIDGASLEVIPEAELDNTKTTTRNLSVSDSPTQPFFNGWLWLAAFAIALMVLSQQSNSYPQRFAIRFATIYWLLYSFPVVVTGIGTAIVRILAMLEVRTDRMSELLGQLTSRHKEYTETAVHWTADHVFGIEGQLVLPNGSGDTTFAYIRIFGCCMIALGVASLWTGVYWRKGDQTWLRDILRTYLRYVLALTMLSYGLAKTGFNMTQFAMDAMPRDGQLSRTFGDASPMGLLWTFMAASPAYTFFAGMGEVIGGLLLVFRRTATLGALATFGVMVNVMMLNFCYDVPVKQYSFHLVMMALVVAMPDFPRLFSLLVLNRTTEPSNLMTPPYTNRYTVWIPRLLKIIVVTCAFAWPVGEQVFKEVKFYQTDSVRQRQEQAESEHLLINRGFRWINEYPYNR